MSINTALWGAFTAFATIFLLVQAWKAHDETKDTIFMRRWAVLVILVGLPATIVSKINDSNKHTQIIENQERSEDTAKRTEENTGEILALLKRKETYFQPELDKEYPFGYFVFGRGDDGYAHLPFRRVKDGVTIKIEDDWFPLSLEINQGIAFLLVADIAFDAEDGGIIDFGPNMFEFELPFRKGEKTRSSIAVGRWALCLEVLHDDPRQPVFVLGFRESE